MRTYRYDVTYDLGFGMYTTVRLDLTAEETTGIVKLMNASREQTGFAPIKLISLVLEGEDDGQAEA